MKCWRYNSKILEEISSVSWFLMFKVHRVNYCPLPESLRYPQCPLMFSFNFVSCILESNCIATNSKKPKFNHKFNARFAYINMNQTFCVTNELKFNRNVVLVSSFWILNLNFDSPLISPHDFFLNVFFLNFNEIVCGCFVFALISWFDNFS